MNDVKYWRHDISENIKHPIPYTEDGKPKAGFEGISAICQPTGRIKENYRLYYTYSLAVILKKR